MRVSSGLDSRFDVAIVGCGPAGAAAALTLVRAGARVLVLERSRVPMAKPGEILAASIVEPLAQVGLLSGFLQLPHLRGVGTVVSWGGTRLHEAGSIADPHGGAFFMHRACFEGLLQDAVRNSGAVLVVGASRVTAMEDHSGVELRWIGSEAGGRARCDVLIEATGRCGAVRRSNDATGSRRKSGAVQGGRGAWRTGPGGIGASSNSREGRREFLDRLIALTLVAPGVDHSGDHRFRIEAAPNGWWYAAPLPDQHGVLSLLMDAAELPAARRQREQFFLTALAQTRLMPRLDRLEAQRFSGHTSVQIALACTSRRTSVCTPRSIAVGDASSAYDPLTGIGVPFALTRGAAVARLIQTERTLMRAFAAYAEAEADAYAQFGSTRREIYGRERRWAMTRFWSARQPASVGA